jgi:hypothetical protein
MIRQLSAFVVATVALAFAPHAFALAPNPVLDAAKAIGSKGVSNGPAPATSPTAFKPSGSSPYADAYFARFIEIPAQRRAMMAAYKTSLEDLKELDADQQNDAAAALALSVAALAT